MENEIIPSDSCFCFSCWPKRRNCISWWCIIMMSRLAGQNRKLIFSKLHLLWPQYVLKTSHAPNIDSYHSTSSLNQHHLLFLLQISFLFLLLLLDVFKFQTAWSLMTIQPLDKGKCHRCSSIAFLICLRFCFVVVFLKQ